MKEIPKILNAIQPNLGVHLRLLDDKQVIDDLSNTPTVF